MTSPAGNSESTPKTFSKSSDITNFVFPNPNPSAIYAPKITGPQNLTESGEKTSNATSEIASGLIAASQVKPSYKRQDPHLDNFLYKRRVHDLGSDSAKQSQDHFELPKHRQGKHKRSKTISGPQTSAGSWENAVFETSKVASKSYFTPQLKPASSSSLPTDFQLFRPDERAFDDTKFLHKERAEALGIKTAIKVPPTPVRKGKQSCLPMPSFITNALGTFDLVERKVLEAKQGAIEPFNLTIAPGLNKLIAKIEKLPSTGEHSQVYKCTVEGEGEWVLKILNADILNKRGEAISAVASQLFIYWQNCRNSILNRHVAKHVNFDCHLPNLDSIENFGSLSDRDKYLQVRKYVENTLQHGFIFAEYVPTIFPEKFSKDDTAFVQLKQIFKESRETGIENDIRFNNVRLDNNKQVQIIDLYECYDGELSTDPKEQARTFASNPEEQSWLIE